jgi:hypothetical protein
MAIFGSNPTIFFIPRTIFFQALFLLTGVITTLGNQFSFYQGGAGMAATQNPRPTDHQKNSVPFFPQPFSFSRQTISVSNFPKIFSCTSRHGHPSTLICLPFPFIGTLRRALLDSFRAVPFRLTFFFVPFRRTEKSTLIPVFFNFLGIALGGMIPLPEAYINSKHPLPHLRLCMIGLIDVLGNMLCLIGLIMVGSGVRQTASDQFLLFF